MRKLLFSISLSLFTIFSAFSQTTISPNNGNRGQSLPIIISGQSGNFTQASAVVILSQGSYVMSTGTSTGGEIKNVNVINTNTITAQLNIPSVAPTGFYNLFVQSGTQTYQNQAFMVNQGTPSMLTINPAGGKPGSSLTNVTVTVPGASFKQTSVAGIQSVWLSRNGEIINTFTNIQVQDPTTFTADLSIPSNAKEGLWDLNVFSNNEVMYYRNGIFDIDNEFSLGELINRVNLSVYPNPGKQVINIQFDNYSPGKISFRLIDLSGKELEVIDVNVNQQAGKAIIYLDEIPKGTYIIQMLDGGNTVSSKMWISG